MKYHAATHVDAPVDAVWATLTDGPAWPSWEPNVTALDGTIAPGERITVHTTLSDQAFPVTVAFPEPGRVMTWTGGMPLGLFRGVRTFALRPADGGTQVEVTEVFTGLLRPIMARVMPDLQPSFDAFVAALAARVEAAGRDTPGA